MPISTVRADNFRPIGSVDLRLDPFTVLIGPNGSGKSSLLQLLQIFSRLENQALFVESFAPWGGYPLTVRSCASEPRMRLGIGVVDGKFEWNYDVELFGESPSGFFVRSEALTRRVLDSSNSEDYLVRDDSQVKVRQKPRMSGGHIGHGSSITLPAQRVHFPEFGSAHEILKRVSLWQVHKFQPGQVVRAPQQLQPTTALLNDGSNLFSAIYTLKTERRTAYRVLLETLQSAIPELEDIDFVIAGAGHVNLTWIQKNTSQPFYTNQLSDGTLRLLWLATVLQSAPDESLLLIDEPELSLHPEWVMILVAMLREASARCTVVVATQSVELVRWVDPKELVIADATESGVTFKRASEIPDLAKWLKEFSLSELWTMGQLGGRQ